MLFQSVLKALSCRQTRAAPGTPGDLTSYVRSSCALERTLAARRCASFRCAICLPRRCSPGTIATIPVPTTGYAGPIVAPRRVVPRRYGATLRHPNPTNDQMREKRYAEDHGILTGLAAGDTLSSTTTAYADCGEVSITEMNRASSQIITEVSEFLMEQG